MPPQCRPECVISSECPQDRACVKQKCIDPCPGTCGANAICKVVNHNAICSCARGYSGDPFIGCSRIECKHNSKMIFDVIYEYILVENYLQNQSSIQKLAAEKYHNYFYIIYFFLICIHFHHVPFHY